MKNIGIILTSQQYQLPSNYNSYIRNKSQDQCSNNQWSITEPSIGPYDYRLLVNKSVGYASLFEDEELRKLEINLQLNKLSSNKAGFIHTNIPERINNSSVQIPTRMLKKTQEIKPEIVIKKKTMHKLTGKQIILQNNLLYNLDNSLQYKFPKSPVAVIKKQHQPKSRKKMINHQQISLPVVEKIERDIQKKYVKQNSKAEKPIKRDMAIKIIDDFQVGHKKFKGLMEDASKIAGKYRI